MEFEDISGEQDGEAGALRKSYRFSAVFANKVKDSDDVVELIANLKFINYVLCGMTDLLSQNEKARAESNDDYYDKTDLDKTL